MHHTSSGVNLANESNARDGVDVCPRDNPPNGVLAVATPSSGTAGDTNIEVERRARKEFEYQAGSHNIGNKEQSFPRRALGKLRDAKAFARPLVNGIALCGNRDAIAIEVRASDGGPSMTQRPDFIDSHSHTHQHAENAISNVERDRQESVPHDSRMVEKRSMELDEIERLRRALSTSRAKVAELEQSKDQVASHRVSSVLDTCSDTDVIRALQRLNAEIQQNGIYMADFLIWNIDLGSAATVVTTEQRSASESISSEIGPVLAKCLASRPREVLFFLEIAFQAYLVATLGQIASAWAADPRHNSFINGIYQTLRDTEAQATSGHWRSLARLYNPINKALLVERLVAGLSNVLLVAGCTAPRSEVIAKITSHFQEKITSLVDFAMRLNKMFDEVLSSDFEVLLVQPGDTFGGETMEEADGGEGGVHEESVVLCATHLGLMKRAPVGTLWEKGQKQQMTVLKAVVLLEDDICDASEGQTVDDGPCTTAGVQIAQGQGRLPRKRGHLNPGSDSVLAWDATEKTERLPRKK